MNACPKDAISMVVPNGTEIEGFLYPEIDVAKCIECGLCERSCPVLHPSFDNRENPPCYAMWAEDDIREVSSSGGAFTVLANSILDNEGIVAGAAYTEDCYGIEYRIATSREELDPLRGSKYAQSNVGIVFRSIKTALKGQTPVLFVGCPCQVAGLKAFLGHDDPNLYTVDLVCHGVPSTALMKRFVKQEEEKVGSKAVRLSFRDKSFVPWNISTSIDFANGETYRKKRSECAFLRAFIDRIMFRDSCGHCPFATLPRQGDLTLADFWDIHRHDPALDDHKGTSLVLTNNEKGDALLKTLMVNGKLCVEAPLEHGIRYNAQIKYSSIHNEKKSRFYELLSRYHYPFEKAVRFTLEDRYDVGFVGWWYGANYGSALTAFALNRTLDAMGKTVLMLPWPMSPSSERILSAPIVKTFYEYPEFHPLDQQFKYNRQCDTFIVGSDQLWNWWSNRDVGTYYFFLDWVDDEHKKLAYSTSFGHDLVHYPKEMRLKIGYLLSRFDGVSVRERSGIAVCKRDFGADAVQTIDPVFLCGMDSYAQLANLSKVEMPSANYVLAYILNPTDDKTKSILHIARELGTEYRIILDGQGDFTKLKETMGTENVIDSLEVEDWLSYFLHASYVITDSFHGSCFSVIFKKNMTIFPNVLRGKARFDSLDEITGIGSRYVNTFEELLESKMWLEDVNHEAVEKRMEPLRIFSRNWLTENLAGPKLPPKVSTLQYEQAQEMLARIERLESASNLDAKLRRQFGQIRNLWRMACKNTKENGLVDTAKRTLRKIKRKLTH